MNWLRRLAMRLRGARQIRRRRGDYQPRHLKIDCLPSTPPAAARCEQCGCRDRTEIGGLLMCAACGALPVPEWPPRIVRWVRVGFPVGDDTILLPPIRAQMVLDLMANGFAWDVQ